MRIFDADKFRPFARRAPTRYGRRPGHREDAFILDRELELQSLVHIGGVGCKAVASLDAANHSCAQFFRFFRGFVTDEPITFHHM
jgi:hypothetical protein